MRKCFNSCVSVFRVYDSANNFQDAFSDYIPAIAERAELADVPHLCRNSYHQSAAIGGGAIGGRYGMITDFCSAIKLERERLKNKVLQEQQAHRAGLEDARVAKEALESEVRASKEAARLAKEAAKKIKPKVRTYRYSLLLRHPDYTRLRRRPDPPKSLSRMSTMKSPSLTKSMLNRPPLVRLMTP